jgi:hypothetical protein
VQHEHITQHKFRVRSQKYINDLEKKPRRVVKSGDFVIVFDDSDNEDDDQENHEDPGRRQARSQRFNANVAEDLLNARKDGCEDGAHDEKVEYEELDRPIEGREAGSNLRYSLFPAHWGHGPPTLSPCCVISLLDESTPLYFWQIDSRKLKMTYSDSEGLPIAFVFHKKVLEKSLKACRKVLEKSAEDAAAQDGGRKDKMVSTEDSLLAYREKLLKWLTDLVRSPLPESVINWFLDTLESGMPTVVRAPMLSHLDLSVIAHCVAISLPRPNNCSELFSTAFLGGIPKEFLRFCKRKNELYGIHVVKGGTLKELTDSGAGVQECSLGYDALTQSKDNASMYLEIIGKFSALTWIVYVMGLDKIDDSLLKWLAEYTKDHPWRFVFLEDTQTSWNFSENRDRCVQDFAPAPIERELAYKEDLDQPSVSQLRPTHLQPYPRIKESLLFDESRLRSMDWDQMAAATVSFFFQASSGSAQGQDSSAPDARPIDAWHAFNKTVKVQENFQQYCNGIFDQDDPCLVLLCSPPGKCATHALMVTCYLCLL